MGWGRSPCSSATADESLWRRGLPNGRLWCCCGFEPAARGAKPCGVRPLQCLQRPTCGAVASEVSVSSGTGRRLYAPPKPGLVRYPVKEFREHAWAARWCLVVPQSLFNSPNPGYPVGGELLICYLKRDRPRTGQSLVAAEAESFVLPVLSHVLAPPVPTDTTAHFPVPVLPLGSG